MFQKDTGLIVSLLCGFIKQYRFEMDPVSLLEGSFRTSIQIRTCWIRRIWALVIQTLTLEAFLKDVWSWYLLLQRSALTLQFFFIDLETKPHQPFAHSSKFDFHKRILLKDIKLSKKSVCVCVYSMYVFEKLIWKAWQWKQYRHTVKGALNMMEREKSEGWKEKKWWAVTRFCDYHCMKCT